VRLRDSLYVSSWSSDGRGRGAAVKLFAEPGIFVYSMPDGKLQKFTAPGMFPVWLNDNRRLLFRGSSSSSTVLGDAQLYILDTQSGTSHVIHEAPPGSFFWDGIPISPNNRTIYYPLHTVEADLWLRSRR